MWFKSWYLHWLQNGKSLKLECPFFSQFMKWNWRPLSLKSWLFEAKFKSQALDIIRIKYWKSGGSGNPPSLIPALWNIGILLYKQATRTKHFDGKCKWENLPTTSKIDRKLWKIRFTKLFYICNNLRQKTKYHYSSCEWNSM